MTALHLIEAKVPSLVTTLQLRGTSSSYCMMAFHLVEAKVPLLVTTLQFTVRLGVQKWFRMTAFK
jgi:hypothetical protein